MTQKKLFNTTFVPGKPGSGQLFEEEYTPVSGPVTCLGMTFENDEARRAHFTEELCKKLQDPEFRKIEGFPIGSDEDILNLSDPPYYTACPNPWIADFIAEWEAQKPEQPVGYHYHREPFASDVSEGKISTNWKELRNLPKDDPPLVAKARDRWYVPDPNKAGDLEKLREKALLKEFEEYKEVKKKLKVFRLEAVRAGFKKAWQERDYAVIVAVADKIPNNVLEEDPKLLMWYDQAVTRMGGE